MSQERSSSCGVVVAILIGLLMLSIGFTPFLRPFLWASFQLMGEVDAVVRGDHACSQIILPRIAPPPGCEKLDDYLTPSNMLKLSAILVVLGVLLVLLMVVLSNRRQEQENLRRQEPSDLWVIIGVIGMIALIVIMGNRSNRVYQQTLNPTVAGMFPGEEGCIPSFAIVIDPDENFWVPPDTGVYEWENLDPCFRIVRTKEGVRAYMELHGLYNQYERDIADDCLRPMYYESYEGYLPLEWVPKPLRCSDFIDAMR